MKKDLNEQISRIKNMMGKIMNESYDDFDTQIQPEERPESDGMDMSDMNLDEEGFKVGDTVSDPVNLNPSPEHDGKILAIFPNLKAAEGQPGYESMVGWLEKYPQYAEGHDVNGKWYLIEWRTEGTGIQSEKDMVDVIIAPDGRNYDDYDEYDEDGDNTCSCCNGTGEGAGETRCMCCSGSGEGRSSKYSGRDDFDGYDDDGGYEYPDGYDGN
jgi:hypothetical protein